MDKTRTVNCSFEAIAWGAIFIWWGITEMFGSLPDGTGAIGIGLILIGLNVARRLSGVAVKGFTTTLGILALAFGVLELAGSVLSLPFDLPIFAILLVVLGVILLAGELQRSKAD